MEMPMLKRVWTRRQTVDAFGGLNRGARIGDGEFAQMENLCADFYPALGPRPGRSLGQERQVTALGAGEGLYYTQGQDLVLPQWRVKLGLTEEGPKTLVNMGAYVLVFPDKKYASTADPRDYGSMEACYPRGTPVTLTPCDLEGADRIPDFVQSTEPLQPANRALWLDTSASPNLLKEWSAGASLWVTVQTAYVRLSAPGIGEDFQKYDGVTLTGAENLDGANVIWAAERDLLVVSGVLEGQRVLEQGVEVLRSVPDMDYVTECGNRLWGCRFGPGPDGKMVNEIYASKLGDFRNFRCFMGLSTDSYTVGVGSQGPFTGAVTYLGSPTFFKEDCLYKIYGSYPAAFRVQSTVCRGVQRGSSESLAIVGETLFYRSPMGICAYDGSWPTEVGKALGDGPFGGGAGAGFGGRYFLSLWEETGDALYVLDTALGQWHREAGIGAVQLRFCQGKLYGLDGAGQLVTLRGQDSEEQVAWSAKTGRISGWDGKSQILTGIELQMMLSRRAQAQVSVRYDDTGPWEVVGTMTGTDRRFSLPVRPKPCAHLELRLEGQGDMRLYSVTRVYRQGRSGL